MWKYGSKNVRIHWSYDLFGPPQTQGQVSAYAVHYLNERNARLATKGLRLAPVGHRARTSSKSFLQQVLRARWFSVPLWEMVVYAFQKGAVLNIRV